MDKEVFSNFIETSTRKPQPCETIQQDDTRLLLSLHEPSTATVAVSTESGVSLSIISSPLKLHILNHQANANTSTSVIDDDDGTNMIAIWEKLVYHDDEIQKLTMGFTSCLETIRQLNEKLRLLVSQPEQKKEEGR